MTDLAPLRHRAFRRLLVGRTVTHLGNAIAPIALAFAVLDLTGSVSALGLVVAARSVANVALLMLGGVVADRLPRSVVLTGSELLAAVTQGAVAALVLTGSATLPLLTVLGVLNGAAAAAAMPATSALVPQTVPPALIRQANALSRMGVSAAMIGGAALGGVLVAAVGPGWGLALDALSFLVAAVAFAGIRVPRVAAGGASVVADLREGWVEFRSRQWVWVIVLQFGVVNAATVGAVAVLGPAVADEHVGRAGWGVALAMQSLGLLVGGVVALRWQPRRALLWGTALSAGLALPVVALAGAPTTLVLALAFFASGLAIEQFAVAWDVSLQENVPGDRLGRVYSYDALGSFIAIPLGEVAVGPVSERVGLTTTLVGCAVLIVGATGAALLSRDVRTLTRRTPEGAAPAQSAPAPV